MTSGEPNGGRRNGQRRGQPKSISSNTSPERLEDQQRAHEAVRLAIEGKSWDDIAQTCGYYDRGTAHRAVERFMASYPAADVETLRQLNIRRMYDLVIAPNALAAQGYRPDGSPREKGPDLWAQSRIIEAVDRIAKWTGTDGPPPLPPAGDDEPRPGTTSGQTLRDYVDGDPHRARELARALDAILPKRSRGPADPVVIEHDEG